MAEPILDLGVKETYLEIEEMDEAKLMYSITNPLPTTVLRGKILIGLLNKWELIIPNDDKGSWNNIKAYFSKEMGENISSYFLSKVKKRELDFSASNVAKLQKLVNGKKLDNDEESKESPLLFTIYMALICPVFQMIKESSYFSRVVALLHKEKIEKVQKLIAELESKLK